MQNVRDKLACKLQKIIGLLINLDLKRAWNQAFYLTKCNIFLRKRTV